jgi:hypothetical protein
MATTMHFTPTALPVLEESTPVEIPPAFYSDVPPPPPPPDDPHWREWPRQDPPPRPDNNDSASDRVTMMWIMGVFAVTVLLHAVAFLALIVWGHPG